MPKCPKCKEEMTKNADGVYVCKKDGVFVPKSIFGVTE
jgi:hypothetical protein